MRIVSCMMLVLIVLACALPSVAGEPEQAPQKIKPYVTDNGLELMLFDVPGNDFAYLETTLMGDMDSAFSKLFKLGQEQGLIGEKTSFGSYYPTDLSQGVDETTPVYAAFSLEEGMEIAEPLQRGAIAPGAYLVAQHWGDYAQLEQTYTKVYGWAKKNGISLGFPTFEVYRTDPETTPVENWLTLIYFPCDADELKPMFDEAEGADTAVKEAKESK